MRARSALPSLSPALLSRLAELAERPHGGVLLLQVAHDPDCPRLLSPPRPCRCSPDVDLLPIAGASP